MTISSATDIGTLVQVLDNTALVNQQIAKLTQQSSSGYVSTDYAGLGDQARPAIDLTVQLALNTTLQANADAAANLQQVAQTALGQIETIVSGFTPQVLAAQTTGSTSLDTLSATARADLTQVASLLDTKVGDVYVFAGQDSANPPVPDPSAITGSAFYAAVQTAVATLGTLGPGAVQAQGLAAAAPGATSPFSATLEASQAPAGIDVGASQRIQVGVLADQNSDAVSAGLGTSSTGSYTRDILLGLATIGALTPVQAADPQIDALLQNTGNALQAATSALNTDIGGLGARQAQVTLAKADLADTATALTARLAGAQEVDLATVSTQLSEAQTQLQASYHVIAALGQLSLAKFLPA